MEAHLLLSFYKEIDDSYYKLIFLARWLKDKKENYIKNNWLSSVMNYKKTGK
jgi:hypothetical protein